MQPRGSFGGVVQRRRAPIHSAVRAMIELGTISLFVAAVMVLLMSPGPNMAFVIAHGVAHGWRGGVAAALGIGAADVVLTAVTVAGITPVIAQWPPAFDLIRFAGAIYLLWLAAKALQLPSELAMQTATQRSLSSVALRAMLNSLLNPKALLFFMVFLPQFVDPGHGMVAQQLLLLGGTLTIVSVTFHAALGSAGATVAKLMAGKGNAGRWPARGVALVMLLLAIRLMVMQEPS